MLAQRKIQGHDIEAVLLQHRRRGLESRGNDHVEADFGADLADDGALDQIVVDNEKPTDQLTILSRHHFHRAIPTSGASKTDRANPDVRSKRSCRAWIASCICCVVMAITWPSIDRA